MIRQPVAKADHNPPMQNGHSDAFKEAHRRTMAHDSNLNSFGVKSMTDDEYKIRFASNLADVHAERKAQSPAVTFGNNVSGPRDDGTGKNEGKNPALRSTAPGPRDDGSGVTATDAPAKSRQPIQPPSNAKNGRIHKQAVGGILDLANPFHIATRIVRRSR